MKEEGCISFSILQEQSLGRTRGGGGGGGGMSPPIGFSNFLPRE